MSKEAEKQYLDAIARGDLAYVKAYILSGKNPNVVNCQKESPLHIAIKHKRQAIFRFLLKYTTDAMFQHKNEFDRTPYMIATDYKNKRALKYMEEHQPKENQSLQRSTVKNGSPKPFNLWSYMPEKRRNSLKKSPNVYNNRNTKTFTISNKVKQQRKPSAVTVKRLSK